MGSSLAKHFIVFWDPVEVEKVLCEKNIRPSLRFHWRGVGKSTDNHHDHAEANRRVESDKIILNK